MEILEKLFGQKLLLAIGIFIIGVLFVLSSQEVPLRYLGILLCIFSILKIMYEAKLRYYIKSKSREYSFKSGREKFIAYYLDKKKIKYVYEKPLKLGNQTLHPDFHLPEFDVYVEYWGGFHDKEYYEREYQQKKKLYREYDVPVVELFPDNLVSIQQLDWKFTERLLNILKKERS